MIAFALYSAFALLVIFGALRDVVSFTIPNWVSLAIVALFVPAAFAAGLSPAGAGLHLAVGFAALIAGMALFGFKVIGGGDAKLMAAIALWMGWPDIWAYLAVAAMMGGGLTIALIMARRFLTPAAQSAGLSIPLLERKNDIPYGVALAGAALMLTPKAHLTATLLGAAM